MTTQHLKNTVRMLRANLERYAMVMKQRIELLVRHGGHPGSFASIMGRIAERIARERFFLIQMEAELGKRHDNHGPEDPVYFSRNLGSIYADRPGTTRGRQSFAITRGPTLDDEWDQFMGMQR